MQVRRGKDKLRHDMNCQGLLPARLIAIAMVMALSNSVGAEEHVLPKPPQQATAWEPPATTLPPPCVDACKAIFEHGVADPRGCDYREVWIRIGSEMPQGLLLKTHAFVLPDCEGQARFAIGWNGLVYPVEQLGEPADLSRDMAEVLRQVEVKKHWRVPTFAGRGEADALSAFSNQSIKSALLLRLGRTSLAEKTWGVRDRLFPGNDYECLALHFHLLALQRLNNAHRRGDDRMALVAAEQLARFEKHARQYVQQAGGPKPEAIFQEYDANKLLGDFQEYDANKLLADQQRRAKQRQQSKSEVRQPRISQLIADLENLTAVYHSPDFFVKRYSPAIRAILDRDEEAIGPLLACLENDARLTRDLNENLYGPVPSFREVNQVAGRMAVQILDADVTNAWSTIRHDPAADTSARAKVLREIAAKTAGLSRAKRWQFYLAEESASPGQWARAAQRIVRPVDEIHDHPGGIITLGRRPGAPPALSGESLRSETDPSITELLQARIDQVVQRLLDRAEKLGDQEDTVSELGDAAVKLMHCLAVWDPKAAREPLKKGFAALVHPRVAKEYTNFAGPGHAEHVAQTAADRLTIDDTEALSAYLDWLTQQSPAKLESSDLRQLFQPLVQFAHDDRSKKAAETMFNREGSPWNPILQPRNISGNFYYGDLIASPLVTVPAFRQQLLRELKNRSPAGELRVIAPGKAEGKSPYNYSSFSSPTNAPGDPRNTAVGKAISLRVCDLYARSLFALPGMPDFSLLWTEAHRDAAIADCRTILEQYGARYRLPANPGFLSFPDVNLVFDPLGHAATKGDVDAARAIFTLQGMGSSRLVPLKRYPLQARRYRPGHDQPDWGLVWQAEEIELGGRTERYYGFVGSRGMGKVPGVEIEFDSAEQVSPWSSFHAELDVAGQIRGTMPVVALEALTAMPVAMELRFHNLRGAQQSVPSEWLRRVGDTWRWREGVELRLTRTIKDDPRDYFYNAFSQEIPGRPVAYFRPLADEPQRRLESEAAFTVAKFDLRRWFDITEPGSYALQIRLPGKSGAASAIATCRFDVLSGQSRRR
jgi:hypothetical protein